MGVDMPRQRSIQQMERDAAALGLRREHLSYRQIATHLGVSAQGAYDMVQRALRDTIHEVADEERQIELARLDELAQKAREILHKQHFAVSNSGKIVCHPETGEPLTDSAPALAALRELRALGESRRKLIGLDAPAKAEVRHVDSFDADIAALVADLARRGEGPTEGHPEVRAVADESPA